MSDPIPTPQPVTDSTSGGQADPNTVASLPDWAQRMIRDLRTEAAQHRTAVQEVTTERDTARSALSDRHRADALGGLDKLLADPDDLARYVNLDELVDDAGNPDPAKYAEAAKSLTVERPHLGIRRPASSGGEVGGAGSYARPVDPDAAAQAGTDAFVGLINGS